MNWEHAECLKCRSLGRKGQCDITHVKSMRVDKRKYPVTHKCSADHTWTEWVTPGEERW